MRTEIKSSPDRAPCLLAARGLRYTYADGTVALRAIDLDLEAGTVLGVLGPNGSGKSTLLRLAASGHRPSRGDLTPFPAEPSLRPQARRARVAALFDQTPYLDSLDGRRNLLELVRLRGRSGSDASTRVDGWIDRLGLTEAGNRAVGTFSLGMRRRLGLAEAFASGAELLLLDEPLLGLDPEGRRVLAGALAEHRARGGGAILSLHDGRFATRVCDRVIFLHRGEIVGQGTPAQLIAELGRETVFEVELARGERPEATRPPSGFRLLGSEPNRLRLASAAGPAGLARLVAWILDYGQSVEAIRVREPGLEDVFFELAGTPLAGEGEP